ncbi:MAG: cupin domain-containing protein [Bacillus sp. (in: firmicutes)]
MTKPDVTLLYFEQNGFIPNNPYLPVLHYKKVLKNNEDKIEKIFLANKWGNTWINGIFDYHHYHSNSHEVLGVIKGSALLLLGGETGTKVIINSGDIILLPAGTGHKMLSASPDFQVVGAYPNGQSFNVKKNTKEDLEGAEKEIQNTAFPEADPIYEERGPLAKMWRKVGE